MNIEELSVPIGEVTPSNRFGSKYANGIPITTTPIDDGRLLLGKRGYQDAVHANQTLDEDAERYQPPAKKRGIIIRQHDIVTEQDR